MQPEYETVVEAGALLSTGIPFLIHLVVVSSQLFLAGYTLVQGCAAAARPDPASYGLRGLGSICPASLGIRGVGLLEIAAGLLLLAPLSLGWPTLASGLGCVLALAVLFILGRREPGVGRRVAVAAAVLTLGFMIWEGEDPATQTARIALKSNEWRNHELDWQLSNDIMSPKVGDLAPDFELEDPSREHAVRLASFRGQRPVALVFGSYT